MARILEASVLFLLGVFLVPIVLLYRLRLPRMAAETLLQSSEHRSTRTHPSLYRFLDPGKKSR